MANLHHPNVLHLIGICFVNQSPMIVLPFMEKDNLLTYVSNPKTVSQSQNLDLPP